MDDGGVVWSSDGNEGGKPADAGVPTPGPKTPANGLAKVRLERQGRGGKVMTVVDNLTGHPARIEEIAKTLKSKCGAGGTVKGRVVEIQGDHRDRIVEVLATLGIASKRAGG